MHSASALGVDTMVLRKKNWQGQKMILNGTCRGHIAANATENWTTMGERKLYGGEAHE